MTDNIFSPERVDNTPPAALDPTKSVFEQLVGEGKKFADAEVLAKSKLESDAFIETLKEEKRLQNEDIKRLSEELKGRARFEEIADKLLSKQEKQPSNDPAQSGNERSDTKPFDPKEIDTLVVSKYQELRQREAEAANRKLVVDTLSEKYGSKYPDVLKDISRKLNLTDDTINSLAGRSPQAIIELVTKTVTPVNVTPPANELRLSQRNDSSEKKESYYEKLRKERPEEYHSPRIQQERMKQAKALGPAYFDLSNKK